MPDKRSISAQIKSGFFIACRLVFGFVVLSLLVRGLSILFDAEAPSHDSFLRTRGGSLLVVIALLIMFVTADRWGGFIAGFFFLPGAMRGFGAFLSGYDYNYPPRPLSRLESGLLVLIVSL